MEGKSITWIAVANLVVAGLAITSFACMLCVQPLYPFDGISTGDRTPVFRWSGWEREYELMIDEDGSFASPLTFRVTGTTFEPEEELDFGTYWWKVRTKESESEARAFTVVSTVALSRPERGAVVNSGNTALLVHVSGLAGAVTLAVNESLETKEDDYVKAEQK
jgi:hypothetical protein